MSALDAIFAKAKNVSACIVLAEGEDPRIQQAAIEASKQGLGKFTLLGNINKIRSALDALDSNIGEEIKIIDPQDSAEIEEFAQIYYELRKHKGATPDAALEAVKNPLTYAGMMLRRGDVDAAIAGAVATTADTVRTAIQVVGKAKGAEIISSCFLMCPSKDSIGFNEPVIFSDCGLVVDPNENELAAIAESAAGSYQALIGSDAKLAFLSFSTNASAKHPNVEKVQNAAANLKAKRPDLMIEGELQFDAAFDASVRAKKAPDSALEGSANIFIFPNLDAGNIGYKLAQRLGAMMAIGPILQGLDKPFNDLSRGCTIDDIIAMIALSACQA